MQIKDSSIIKNNIQWIIIHNNNKAKSLLFKTIKGQNQLKLSQLLVNNNEF